MSVSQESLIPVSTEGLQQLGLHLLGAGCKQALPGVTDKWMDISEISGTLRLDSAGVIVMGISNEKLFYPHAA